MSNLQPLLDFCDDRSRHAYTLQFRDSWDKAIADLTAGNPEEAAYLILCSLIGFESQLEMEYQKDMLREALSAADRQKKQELEQPIAHLTSLLDALAAEYGNRRVWGERADDREVEHALAIIRHVDAKMRRYTDSGDESLDSIVQEWHDAEMQFRRGDLKRLLELAQENPDSHHLVPWLRAYGR